MLSIVDNNRNENSRGFLSTRSPSTFNGPCSLAKIQTLQLIMALIIKPFKRPGTRHNGRRPKKLRRKVKTTTGYQIFPSLSVVVQPSANNSQRISTCLLNGPSFGKARKQSLP